MFLLLLMLLVVALVVGFVKRDGVVWWTKKLLNINQHAPFTESKLITSTPADADGNVELEVTVKTEIRMTGGATIDAKSVGAHNVMLLRVSDHAAVPAAVSVGTDGASLLLKPVSPLEPDTNYYFAVGNGLVDSTGRSLGSYACAFTTERRDKLDASVRFERVELPTTSGQGAGYTCVRVGPDRHLYASADDGRIVRFPIAPDGSVGSAQSFDAVQKAHGGKRLMTGFDFDPASTREKIILWTVHTWYGFEGSKDWQGVITRLSGPNLELAEDVVINLPRSVRDHATNQCSFGPDGALYIPQGSNSAFGAPDPEWAMRPERVLNASILRLDVTKVTPGKPLDAKTERGGSYDPFAPGAPLTIVASGIRMPYDLVWADNGFIYTAVNGATAGGFTPAGPGAPELRRVPNSEHDWLFKIDPKAPIKYHGHPNPHLKHYVLNGGNPTPDVDFAEVSEYPVGTKPDADWQPSAYDFGCHVSANGTLQYKSDVFGGVLKGMLIVCRYNVGSDLICIGLDEKGNVNRTITGLPGLTNLVNPLDVTEDTTNGNLYVSEYGLQSICLLKPVLP